MATQTGSTYISGSMTNIVEIPTANLTFSTTANMKRVSLGDFNNDRQPEMAAETDGHVEFEESDFNSDRQPEIVT